MKTIRDYIRIVEGADHLFENADIASPEFQHWFSGSKVVDRNGDPLKVYHGTRRGGFTTFKTHEGSRSDAFFFTDSRPMALTYSGNDNDIDGNPATTTKHGIYAAYLSVKNPKVINWGGEYFSNRKGQHTNDAVATAKQEGHDGAIITNVNDPGGFSMMWQSRGVVPEGPDIVGNLFVAFSPDQIRIAPVVRKQMASTDLR